MYLGVPRGDTPGEGDGDGGPDGDRDRTGARGPTAAAGGTGGTPIAGTGVRPGNIGLGQPHSNISNYTWRVYLWMLTVMFDY